MPGSFSFSGRTDVGRRRKHNEDSFLIAPDVGLFVVADGMGGHASGEVASAEAVDQVLGMVRDRHGSVIEKYRAATERDEALLPVKRLLESAIQAATYLVFGMAEIEPSHSGMGTTMSTMLGVDDTVVIGQVGDSRVYRVRQGEAQQLTEDHTLINMQLKLGMLTPEEAKTAKHGNLITRAVGIKDYVQVDLFDERCRSGDRFLLCSDGLSDYLGDIAEVGPLVGRGSLDDVTARLIDLANERGGKDNITAVVVEYQEG